MLGEKNLVGVAGFEPTTTTPPVWCATRLRYAPSFCACTPQCGATFYNNQGGATPREAAIIRNQKKFTSLIVGFQQIQYVFERDD